MATTNLNAFLRRLTRGMIAETLADQSDRQLVELFLAGRDGAAFEAIVRRHGPIVYRVCWRVLRQEQDTEDAFQATFVLLAQRVHTLRKRASLASWLHGIAHRVALKAKAEAAVRRCREQRATKSGGPTDQVTWEEVRGLLDSELAGLPEKWRLPLVLCYLEGRTHDEAAEQLGWSVRTLRRRLDEARTALGRRLSRRGVAVPAALSAILFSDCAVSAALPARLVGPAVEAAARIAAGKAVGTALVSAKVLAWAEGVHKTMMLSKLKTTLALVLTAGVIAGAAAGMGLPVLAAHRPPLQPDRAEERDEAAGARSADAPRQASPADKPATQTRIAARGRVLDPDSKPVAGAKLYLGYTGAKDVTYPVRATSGDDGRFEFTIERSELDKVDSGEPTIQVLAVAEGFGCDWATLNAAAEELTLRLAQDVPVSGRILDPDGKAVVGARVMVRGVSAAPGDDLGRYVEEARKGFGIAFAKHWEGPLPGQPAVRTTGADGRFRCTGVGRERVVYFRVEGPAIASTGLWPVMTRTAETIVDPQGRKVYGALFDHVAHASRPVRGVVRDKETGKPLAGVSVEHYHGQGPSALTDKEGRYELLGLAKTRQYSLVVKPPDGLYFRLPVRLQDTPGLGPLTWDIQLTRGLMVRGRVTDKATGKPIARARVEYHPLAGNTHANQMADVSRPCAEAITGPDGSYALTVLPGQGVIGVTGPRLEAYMPALVTPRELKDFFKAPVIERQSEDYLTAAGGANSFRAISQNSYNALVLLEPREKEEELVKDVALERPLELQGRVVGPDGQPLVGVRVCGLTRHGVETLQGAEFTVRGINPRANRPLVFCHKDRNLGCYVKELRGVPAAPLTIKLQPCGSTSGRIIDRDGQPVAGLRLVVQGRALPILSEAGGGSQLVTTDKEGRFRAEGLVPGQEYRVSELHFTNGILRIYAPVQVEPGKHQDLGDIKMDPERQ
jgi:RNA polymerase sigma factor (sigma-70 family)